MLRIISISHLLLLFTFSSRGQSINLVLPENPVIDSILPEWKGYNHGGSVSVSEIQTPDFINAFFKLNPGIIRWPGGNKGNNYRWEDHLNQNNKLNLKKLIPFLDSFNVELQVVVNFGNGTATEAAEFVNICNNQNAYYTQLRDSLLNNPNPIDVKYWEIGNESTDAWAYAYSWLGFQEEIHFRSGVPNNTFTKREADSLYFYGGDLTREGWVEIIGGLDKNTAILGDLKFYPNGQATDTVIVTYPLLDTTDINSVRIYRTSNFDMDWAGDTTTNQQELYDSISNPANLLSAVEFSWDQTQVIVNPIGGIYSNDLILIEYNSTNHDGAFAFRDFMKAADPSIEIGYTVMPDDSLASNLIFQQDFSASPPEFMIKHPYASNLTIPAIQQGYFSEAIYASEKKVQSMVNFGNIWNQRELDWGIPNEIGLSLTEWNVALYDEAPQNHPIRGIICGLYVADFWARTIESALNDSLDLRTMNHYALSAQGNNFIHLLHTNPMFSVGVEGKATTMVMESLAEGMFPVSLLNNPQIDVLTNDGQGGSTLVSIDAISTWGGVGKKSEYINLLLINRDDENSHTIDIDIPAIWQADSIIFESLYGTMIDETVFSSYDNSLYTGITYSALLPAFSVNTVRIHLTTSLGLDEQDNGFTEAAIYPIPSSDFIYFPSKQMPISIGIYNNLGQKIIDQSAVDINKVDVSQLKKGIYFVRAIYSEKNSATYKLVKQ
ncbi:MAG: T9SS type A sorting domain-containing protein [Flavobacteriales bacterium]|nr:T9SS type A sorting domain-containing protein [Flavobacteriales bacterium]